MALLGRGTPPRLLPVALPIPRDLASPISIPFDTHPTGAYNPPEGGTAVSKALKTLEKGGLVHLERLASILRGLTPEELETLELLLDRQARATIGRALKELDRGEGIPPEKW